MRLTTILAVGLLFAGSPVAAQSVEHETSDTEAGSVEPTREGKLDSLFETLRSTSDSRTAETTERDIIAIWLESGSDTVDLLMRWALDAMDDKDFALALDYLDRIIIMQPDYAEAWNKRATVHFLVDDYSKAIADIEQTLALEPRHFGALSGLGTILREIGDVERAVIAFQEALAVDPHLENVKDALDEIETEDGDEI